MNLRRLLTGADAERGVMNPDLCTRREEGLAVPPPSSSQMQRAAEQGLGPPASAQEGRRGVVAPPPFRPCPHPRPFRHRDEVPCMTCLEQGRSIEEALS